MRQPEVYWLLKQCMLLFWGRKFEYQKKYDVTVCKQETSLYSISFPRDPEQQCRNRPQKFTIDISSINPPRKLMGEYWFLAPMSRFAIWSASLNFFFPETFHDNLPVARAKQLGRSMKKTLRVRRRQSYPARPHR